MIKYEKIYETSINKIEQLNAEYPNYKNTWKDVLKPKLIERNEEHVYDLIDKASEEITKEKFSV